MTVWHLMFQKPAFKTADAQHLVDVLQAADSFGGFPLNRVLIVRDTDELTYVDLDFQLKSGLTQPVFADMARYLLVLTARLETAPPPIYYAVMQKSLQELNITYQQYPDHSLDMFYWQRSPIVAEEPDDGLHFK